MTTELMAWLLVLACVAVLLASGRRWGVKR